MAFSEPKLLIAANHSLNFISRSEEVSVLFDGLVTIIMFHSSNFWVHCGILDVSHRIWISALEHLAALSLCIHVSMVWRATEVIMGT
jgi:hypothetical protein